MEYKAWAINDQGASTDVARGETFTSIKAAAVAARAEMGRGWEIHIEDSDGNEVKKFRTRS